MTKTQMTNSELIALTRTTHYHVRSDGDAHLICLLGDALEAADKALEKSEAFSRFNVALRRVEENKVAELTKALAEKDAEIEKLKRLFTRAAACIVTLSRNSFLGHYERETVRQIEEAIAKEQG